MEPLRINGWVWGHSGARISATDKLPLSWSLQPWSNTGPKGNLQPDNYEGLKSGRNENCIAIIAKGFDGAKWHDAMCEFKLPFLCEDSDELLLQVQKFS